MDRPAEACEQRDRCLRNSNAGVFNSYNINSFRPNVDDDEDCADSRKRQVQAQ